MRCIVTVAAAAFLIGYTPTPVRACGRATQYQLYPVGTAKGALIALLVVKKRSIRFAGSRPRFITTATASLVRVLGVAAPNRLAKLGTYKISGNSIRKRLRSVLKTALARARRVPGFHHLRMTRWTVCTSRKSCDGAQAISKAGKLAVRLVKKTKFAPWPLSAIFSRPGDYDIASVRRYASGTQRWAVIDLRAGDNKCLQRARNPDTSTCLDKKQRRQKADGKRLSLRADSAPFHHGHDIAVAIRLR